MTCPPEFVVECKGPHHCPHLTELQALVWALVAWGAVAAEAPSAQHSPGCPQTRCLTGNGLGSRRFHLPSGPGGLTSPVEVTHTVSPLTRAIN